MSILKLLCKSREFKTLLGERRTRLFRMAYAWSHDRALADDLTQETLIKALRHGNQLRDIKALDQWLFGILANCWRDHFRHQRPTEDVDEMTLVDTMTPEHEHTQQHIVGEVRAAIAALPEGQRTVITLVDLEGFSYAEVANIMSIPIGTVMSRLCRARKQLCTSLLEFKPRVEVESPRLRRVK